MSGTSGEDPACKARILMQALPNYAPKAMIQSLRLNANVTSFSSVILSYYEYPPLHGGR